MSENKKIKNYFLPIGIFLFFFLIFLAFFLMADGALCPDSFYHTKMSQLIWGNKELINNFPWLQFATIGGDNFVGQHLLFHILAGPFVFWGNFNGMEIFISFLNASFFTLFYYILKSFKIKQPFLITILLFFSSSFIFRLLLLRAIGLSLILTMLFFYFLTKKKFKLALLISFIFMWSYNAFLITLIMGFCFLLAHLLKKGKIKIEYLSWPALGIILGTIINPYFPKNIFFFYQQVILIPFLNGLSDKVGVGAEWYPPEVKFFVASNLIIWFIFAYIMVYLINNVKSFSKKLSVNALASIFITIVLFLMTIRSQRFVEYWSPFVVLSTALLIKELKPFQYLNNFYKKYKHKFLLTLPLASLSIIIIMSLFISLGININQINNAPLYDRFKNSANWIKQNIEKNKTIYNVSWGNFPELFYWNDNNNYIIGLDPRFMYEYNKSLYKKYDEIQKGQINDISRTVKNDFKSNVIFADNSLEDFIKKANKDGGLKKAYEDTLVTIYLINE